jgi:hypothetical protein
MARALRMMEGDRQWEGPQQRKEEGRGRAGVFWGRWGSGRADD